MKIISFSIVVLILFSFLSFDNKNAAHASSDESGYCPEVGSGPYTAEDLARIQYENTVGAFNEGVDSRAGSIEELNKIYMKPDLTVDELGKMAGCLHEVHGVDPDSVSMFSEKAQAVLSYDMEKLVQIAPELADYATVPEFGSTVMIVMTASVFGTILFYRKFF